jgi:integrase/recombinase XerD
MFQPIIDECKLRNYSKRTITIYLHYNQKFLDFVNKKPQQVTHNDLRSFLLYLIGKGKSSSTVNLAHNALNFYYNIIMKRRFHKIAFQKREKKIMFVPTGEQIAKMIKVTKNQKHKLIISLLYATGVRVSELVNIKLIDIDFKNRLLKVDQGKGNKDRFTIISHFTMMQIEQYLPLRTYKSKFLFAGRDGHVSTRTVDAVIKLAKRKLGIKESISPHSLRRSFATHHMTNGTKDQYVQQMLGHKDIRTTRGYQYVTNGHLLKVKSPQDL